MLKTSTKVGLGLVLLLALGLAALVQSGTASDRDFQFRSDGQRDTPEQGPDSPNSSLPDSPRTEWATGGRTNDIPIATESAQISAHEASTERHNGRALWSSHVQPVAEQLMTGLAQVEDLADLTSRLLDGANLSAARLSAEGDWCYELLHEEALGDATLHVKPGLLGKPGEFELVLDMKESPGGWRAEDTEGCTLTLGFDLDEENSPLGCRAFLQMTNPIVRSNAPTPPPDHGVILSVTPEGATIARIRTLSNPQGISIDLPIPAYPGTLDSPRVAALGKALVRFRHSR